METADLDRVMEIAESLKEAPQWPRAAYETALDVLARPGRVALVAVMPGRGVVGFAVAVVVLPEAELESIGVATEAQRRGVARSLFGFLARELQRKGVTKVQLEVRASNSNAQSLYAALGFAQSGIRARYYADPEEDAVQMHLSIG
jgi:ribosomal-protein-alanine N-acetyltransferase